MDSQVTRDNEFGLDPKTNGEPWKGFKRGHLI